MSSIDDIGQILEKMRTHTNRMALISQRLSEKSSLASEGLKAGISAIPIMSEMIDLWQQAGEAYKDCFNDVESFLDAGHRELIRLLEVNDEVLRQAHEMERPDNENHLPTV